MPEIGEIKRANEIGKLGYSIWQKFIWHACEICGKERWVTIKAGKASSKKCQRCNHSILSEQFKLAASKSQKGKFGENSANWRGGSKLSTQGYIRLWVGVNDFYRPMADKHGDIYEHRLVMAKHLNRCLLSWEVVHHKNGIKDDNRLENLELIKGTGNHNTQLNKTIKLLLNENKRLKTRIIELEGKLNANSSV